MVCEPRLADHHFFALMMVKFLLQRQTNFLCVPPCYFVEKQLKLLCYKLKCLLHIMRFGLFVAAPDARHHPSNTKSTYTDKVREFICRPSMFL